ncbi:c-type cytochrome [Yoonia sp.]|uniref:c-type cytochrome n=1 Tax=Yoonia sp. TaxID=2212373 RepID=UPI003974DB06
MKKRILGASILLFAGIGVYAAQQGTANDGRSAAAAPMPGTPLVQVVIPDQFSDAARIGQRIFDGNCASCHGPNAAGRAERAPPLVHKIYEPSHHGDEAFQRAVAMGVPAHHWPFGDMIPVPGLTPGDVAMVVAYIRELQGANGID